MLWSFEPSSLSDMSLSLLVTEELAFFLFDILEQVVLDS